MKNLLIAQSGGPTAAINATLLGVIQNAITSKDKIGNIYAGINGIKGILDGNIVDITDRCSNINDLFLLETTPSAALGSCRFKLEESLYKDIFTMFKKFDIGYFIYIGGNDSMDTVDKLSLYAKENSLNDVFIMGAPKTIDNDLCETDFTPGFGSAAKYIGVSLSEIICDVSVYNKPCVTIVEIMGRNTGWLTASAALSGINGYKSPQLIYLPECVFDCDQFLIDAQKELESDCNVVVCVSEGIKNRDGKYICEDEVNCKTDAFGHKALSGTGKFLELLLKDKLNIKSRSIELNILQRCASHILSKTDIETSKMLGSAALSLALNGVSGKMACIKRLSDKPFKFEINCTDVSKVANHEKKVPLEFINEQRNNVTDKMLTYLLPLIKGEINSPYENGMPKYFKL